MRFETLLLALSAAFFATFAGAADKLAPESFVGNYQLVEARLGLLCDENMQGLLSKSIDKRDDSFVQIDLGAFSFPAVNLGAQKFEDSLATTVNDSYTTADSIVFESREVSKVDGEISTEKTTATMSGSTLHLVSNGTFMHPGGTRGVTSFECVYSKAATPKQ